MASFPHEIRLDDDTYHKNVSIADLNVDAAKLSCQAEKKFAELEKDYSRVIEWDFLSWADVSLYAHKSFPRQSAIQLNKWGFMK